MNSGPEKLHFFSIFFQNYEVSKILDAHNSSNVTFKMFKNTAILNVLLIKES